MEEKLSSEQMKLLSGMMGADNSDTFQLLERINRLRRLFGSTEEQKPQDIQVKESSALEAPFGSTQGEKILCAAIPFLDMEFQKNIFVAVRFMELRRVLQGTKLEAREKQEDPVYRRHKMLHAVRPYLAAEEKNQLDSMMKIMEIKQIMGARRDDSE